MKKPKKEELYAQGVLQNEGVADSLQGGADSLEHQLIKDKTKHALQKAPKKQAVIDQGIMMDSEKVAPAIQDTSKQLAREMAKDVVARRMSKGKAAEEKEQDDSKIKVVQSPNEKLNGVYERTKDVVDDRP